MDYHISTEGLQFYFTATQPYVDLVLPPYLPKDVGAKLQPRRCEMQRAAPDVVQARRVLHCVNVRPQLALSISASCHQQLALGRPLPSCQRHIATIVLLPQSRKIFSKDTNMCSCYHHVHTLHLDAHNALAAWQLREGPHPTCSKLTD